MAKIYSKERSKYGNITGQIIIWPVQYDSINSTKSKSNLPAGYLRCDGSIYNAVDYPQLAAICGTGTTGKFVRDNIAGEPLQTVSDEQFVVPDLASKYPKATGTAGGGGQYLNIRETTTSGNEISRSGIGIEAQSIGDENGVFKIEYEGSFVIPSHDIPMRGRPSWTVGTTAGKRTDSETVDERAMHPHMHFHTGSRTRLKSSDEVDDDDPNAILDPAIMGRVSLANASTIPLWKWLDNSKNPDDSTNQFPGNSQFACKALISNRFASSKQYRFGDFDGVTPLPGTGNPTAYGGACWNGGGDKGNNINLWDVGWGYFCLLPNTEYQASKGLNTNNNNSTTIGWKDYPITTVPYTVTGTAQSRPKSESDTRVLGICLTDADENDRWPGAVRDMNATYISGATGVPVDWKNTSLGDVVPMQMSATAVTAGEQIYPALFNEFTETSSLSYETDPTEHYHKIDIVKGDHTFQLRTNSVQIQADALNTTLRLDVDESRSVDSVSSPFIVLEYLIKI